jgi:hypothetical protein
LRREEGKEVKPKAGCAHYWIISPNAHEGKTTGTCRLCGVTRAFVNNLDWWNGKKHDYKPKWKQPSVTYTKVKFYGV